MSYTSGSHRFFTIGITSSGSRSIATRCWKARCGSGYERLSGRFAKNWASRSSPAFCRENMSICSWKSRRILRSATSCGASRDTHRIRCRWSSRTCASATGGGISGLGATSPPPAATSRTMSYFSIFRSMNLPAPAGSYSVLEVRPAIDHFLGRIPVRPFLLALDRCFPVPDEAFASNPDAIASGTATLLHMVEIVIGGIDHDRARRFLGRVGDVRAPKRRIDLRQFNGGDSELTVLNLSINRIVIRLDGIRHGGMLSRRRRRQRRGLNRGCVYRGVGVRARASGEAGGGGSGSSGDQ